jgi:hypothetical protein
MNTGVRKFHVRDDEIAEIELESGENVIRRTNHVSTCGVIETESHATYHHHLNAKRANRKWGSFTNH